MPVKYERSRVYSKGDVDAAVKSIDGTPTRSGRGIWEYAEAFGITSWEDFRDKRVLDLGAGLALRFARGLEISKINANVVSLSPAFKEEWARDIGERAGRRDSNSRLAVAAMGEQLPFRDKSFDRIVSHSVFEYVKGRSRKISFLKEVIRVLGRDGAAYIYPIGNPEAQRDYELESVRSMFTKELSGAMTRHRCTVSFNKTQHGAHCMIIRKA